MLHDGPAPSDGTCPGYLIALPGVGEGLTAHLWWEKGQLAERLAGERAGPHLPLYIDVVTGAIAELEVERFAEQHRKTEAAARGGR